MNQDLCEVVEFYEKQGITPLDLVKEAFCNSGVTREKYFVEKYLPRTAVLNPMNDGEDFYDFSRKKPGEVKSPCFIPDVVRKKNNAHYLNFKGTYSATTIDKYNHKVNSNEDIYICQYIETKLIAVVRTTFEVIAPKYLEAVTSGKQSMSFTIGSIIGSNETEVFFACDDFSEYIEFIPLNSQEWFKKQLPNLFKTTLLEKAQMIYGEVVHSVETRNGVIIIQDHKSEPLKSVKIKSLNSSYSLKKKEKDARNS